MTEYFPKSSSGAAVQVSMGAGDYTYVAQGVTIVNTSESGVSSAAINDSSWGAVDVEGEVIGGFGILMTGLSGEQTTIQIGSTGIVASPYAEAVEVAYATSNASHDIVNYGQIEGVEGAGGIYTSGPGTIVNYGSIVSDQDAVVDDDFTSAADTFTLINDGSIVGGYLAFTGDSNNDHQQIVNNGSIMGGVQLGDGSNLLFDSTNGTVDGTISTAGGSDVVIAGQTGGSVDGGSGADVLYANPTRTAANNAAQTTLDGGKGDNWLYGDGAFTTFDSGDNSAGTYNQIFGGQSEMADVAGYANNSVSYAGMSSAYKSAYIDLLHGDAYMCTIGEANGAPSSDFVFEDYLQNVPNVIGSSGSDVIICDDGVDRITHGSGSGDILYAGTGAGSQDTFVYTSLGESPLSHYDVIEGFKVGIDKLDFSKLDLPIADFFLSSGGGGANTVYVEENPSKGFNSATDMIISIQASTSAALTYKDIVA
jgi:hypothetical protein